MNSEQSRPFLIRRHLREIAKRMNADPTLTRRAEHYALDCFEIDKASASAAIRSAERWLKTMIVSRVTG